MVSSWPAIVALPVDEGLKQRVREQLFEPKARQIGRFEVQAELGRGGMGIVYRALDPELDRPIALKVMHARALGDSEGTARLRREARSLAKVVHPNVVGVHEVGEHDGQIFVAMEYVPGVTLRQWLEDEAPPWRVIVEALIGAAAGLRAAHAVGLVHRDFKPDNVLMATDGRPRVVDFGLARAGGATDGAPDLSGISGMDESITVAGMMVGTPAYMAAEQFQGRATDARTDLFAWCVSLHEALYGQRPFKGNTLEQLRPAVIEGRSVEVERGDVPAALAVEIERGLSPRAEDRHADMDQLIAAVERATSRKSTSLAWLWALGGAGLASLAIISALPEEEAAPTVEERAVEPDLVAEILAGSRLPGTYDVPVEHDPTGATVHRLDNGLTIYVVPRREQPRVEARIVFRVGSADDPVGARGAAQLLAAVTENGGARLGAIDLEAERSHLAELNALLEANEPADRDAVSRLEAKIASLAAFGEYRALLLELGVLASSEVSRTSTTFSADLPSAELQRWLRLESERLRNPLFRGFVGAADRQLSRDSDFLDGLGHAVHGDGPLGHDPSGVPRELAALPLAAVRRVHEQYYRPNNAAIVLVGDVDPESAKSLVSDAFADWEPAALPEVGRAPTPTGPGEIHIEEGAIRVAIAWPVPIPSTPEDEMLADLVSSRITQNFERWGAFMGWGHWPGGVAILSDGPMPPAELRGEVENALRWTLEGDNAERELAGPEVIGSLAHALDLEADSLLADAIAAAYESGTPWSDAVRPPGERVTADQLRQAARAALANLKTIVADQPRREPPERRASADVVTDVRPHSAFAESLLAMKVTQHEPQFLVAGRHYQFAEGPWGTVAAAECPGGVARYTIDYPLAGDHRFGTCMSVTLAGFAGMKTLDTGGQTGHATAGVSCDQDYVSVSIESLAAHGTILGSKDIAGWFDEPGERKRAAERIEALAPSLHEGMVSRLREAGTALFLAEDLLLDVTNPRPFKPDFSTDPQQSLDDWTAAVARRPTYSYCGPSPADFVAEVRDGPSRPPGPARAESLFEPKLKGRRVAVFDEPGRSDIEAYVGLALPEAFELSAAVVSVLESYLRNRVEEELYGRVHPRGANLSVELEVTGPVLYCHVRTDVAEAVRAVALTVRALKEASVDADAVRRAAKRVELDLRNERIAPRDIPELVLQWRRDGRDSDPRRDVWDGLPMVTVETLSPLLKALRPAPTAVALVGPLDGVALEGLAFIAPPELVRR